MFLTLTSKYQRTRRSLIQMYVTLGTGASQAAHATPYFAALTQSRSVYDRYGHDGLKQHEAQKSGGGGHHNPFDVFSQFFGACHVRRAA